MLYLSSTSADAVQPESAINMIIHLYEYEPIMVWVIILLILWAWKLEKIYPQIINELYGRQMLQSRHRGAGSGEHSESYDTPNNFVGMVSWLAGQSMPRQNQMYIEQAKIILELAKRGSAVFGGRCADYILREQLNRYSIFIYADDEYRRKIVQEVYKDSSLQDVRDVDAQRKRYYAGQTWVEPKNYDLMINSTNISTEIAADLIMKYVELRQK